MYHILPYTYEKAKQLNVLIYPSNNPKYKISVYNKNGVHITDIGANGYKDYPTYMEEKGEDYARKRRELYKKRHEKDRTISGSRGWYADNLLW